MAVGVAWLAGGYVARSLGFLALTLLLTRALGPAGYGDLGVFLALGTGIGYLAGSWPFLAVPILVAQGTRVPAVLRPAVRVAALSAAALSVLFIPLTFVLLDPVACGAVFVYAASFIGLQALTAVCQAIEHMRGIAMVQTAERLVALAGAALAAVLLGLTATSAEFALAGSMAVTVVATAVLLHRRVRLVSASPADVPVLPRKVLETVGPLSVVMAGAYVVAWIDLFVLATFRPRSEVGTYALAYQIYTFVYQISAMWITVALPRHLLRIEAGERSPEALLRPTLLTDAAVAWAATVALGGVVGVFAFPLLFGASFRDGLGPLLVLLAGASLLPIYMACAPVFMALGEAPMLARLGMTSSLLNVGIDLALVPWLGQWGAAVATATTMSYMGAVLLARATEWHTVLSLFKAPAVLAAACAGIAVDPGSVAAAVPAAVLAPLALANVGRRYLPRRRSNERRRRAPASP